MGEIMVNLKKIPKEVGEKLENMEVSFSGGETLKGREGNVRIKDSRL